MSYTQPLYRLFASLIQARENCRISGNTEWYARHEERMHQLCRDHMPSGSGVDCGTAISLELSRANKLVFTTSFHHMSEHGMYDGWTEHSVIVSPSLVSPFELRITGRDRNDIKEYLHELFYNALTVNVE